MSKAETYTKSGTKAAQATELPKSVFGVEVKNSELLQTSVRRHLANTRQNVAHTKTRGLVRGGGRKPHAQKGTGNARAGSIRSPIWRGGGITFGPTGQANYRLSLSKGSRSQALRQALSLKAEANQVKVIDELNVVDGKTRTAEALLRKLGVGKRTLLVADKLDAVLVRATRNLAGIKLSSTAYLTPYAVLMADMVVITKPALGVLETRLAKSKPKVAAAQGAKT